jgi:hypothetical protein
VLPRHSVGANEEDRENQGRPINQTRLGGEYLSNTIRKHYLIIQIITLLNAHKVKKLEERNYCRHMYLYLTYVLKTWRYYHSFRQSAIQWNGTVPLPSPRFFTIVLRYGLILSIGNPASSHRKITQVDSVYLRQYMELCYELDDLGIALFPRHGNYCFLVHRAQTGSDARSTGRFYCVEARLNSASIKKSHYFHLVRG